MSKDSSKTYVGDIFTVAFLNADQDPYRIYNGMKCKILGFKRKIVALFPHETLEEGILPGVYEMLGNPVVKLETGQNIEISLSYLIPQGYDYDDEITKNSSYYIESSKFKFLSHLPNVKFNVGDKVLIASHSLINRDYVGRVLDAYLKGPKVFYLVSNAIDPIEVRQEMIIDVLERGQISEMLELQEKYGIVIKGDCKYRDIENDDKIQIF